MAGASSSNLRSAYIAETTPGTIPSTPGFTTLDVPALIRATPQIAEQRSLVMGGERASQAVRGFDVSGSMSGQMIYGNYDGWLETLLQGAWSTNVLKNGKSVKTMAVENTIPAGAGGTNTMMRYRGVQAVGGSITAASREDIMFNLDLRGMGSDVATTSAIAGATYSDPSAVIPLTAGVDVGTITMAGYTLDCFARVEMLFNYEGREDQPKLGSTDLCGITRGALVPIINARMYVEANFEAIYDEARANHTAFAVSIPIGSVSGSKYTFDFPQCAFAAGDLDFSGSDAMIDVQILPQYDNTTENCTVKVTRAVS